jgi:hypothetical protein
LPSLGQVRALAEHPRTAGLLFAGTETGIFASRADGRWLSLKNNLPTAAVHDIVVHPRENDLVIGTHGRGFWILDDVAALEEYRPEGPPADAALFRARPAIEFNRFDRGRSALGQMFFAAPNPPDGALLTYYVNPRAAAEPITLEIIGGGNRVVRRLDVPQGQSGAGLQRVVWDLRYDASFTPAPGAPGQVVRGPWVLPGEYQARLSAGGATRTQPLSVAGDPLVMISAADRRSWHDFQVSLASLLGTARAMAVNAQAIETSAREAQEALKSAPAATDASRASADRTIAGAQGLLVALRGGGSAAADTSGLASASPIEPLLSQLYGAIQGSTGLPTEEQQTLARRAQDGLRVQLRPYDRLVNEETPALGRAVEAAGLRWTAPALLKVPTLVPLPAGRRGGG